MLASPAPSAPRIQAPAEARPGPVAFRFTAHERGLVAADLRYRCGFDRRTLVPCKSPYVARLAEGRHVFRVQALDPHGRRSPLARAVVNVEPVAPSVQVGIQPVAATFGFGSLWTADYAGGTVTRLEGGKVVRRIDVGAVPGGVAVAGGSVWVGHFQPGGRLARIDPGSNKVIGEFALGGQPAGLLGDGDTLWLADYAGAVERIDARNGHVIARIAVKGQPEALALGFGLLWVTNQDGTLSTIDPATGRLVGAKIVGDPDLDAVAIGKDAVWSTSYGGASLLKIDPTTRKVVLRVRLNGSGGGVLATPTAVWASVYGAGEVLRVDPRSGRITRRIRVGTQPRDIVSDGTSLWVINQGSDSISKLPE
jgi:streptogramin lyase